MTDQPRLPDTATTADDRTPADSSDADRTPADSGGADRTPAKDPDDWVTGDEPMTGPQASYLDTLAREAGEEPPGQLTKAEASRRIDELQDRTGRGA
jgi:hypothetical protein